MSHPIVALWAHPRSMSTATERVMRERGDCTVFHEPFLVDYYLNRGVSDLAMLEEDKTKPQDYEGVRSMLLDAAGEGPVFFKDMSYYVVPRIFEDAEFARRLCNVFLIRDPRRSIASYYKLDPTFSLEEVGIEAQWQHYCYLKDRLDEAPMVIEAEAVAEDPQGTIGRLWSYAGLPYAEKAFEWNAEDEPADWQYVRGWHDNAASSSGIRRDDKDPKEVFGAVADKGNLREYLAHHWVFYEKLKAVAEG